jgi:hypothetical protein
MKDHAESLQCSIFGHSLCLLFYISSSRKGTFCDTVLLKSAISLVSSSNTWYLREIKGESWSGPGNGCHRRYCQVMTEGRDNLSFYWRMSLITKLRLAKVEGGIHNNEENTLLNFQSSLWCRIQDPFLIPSPPAAGGIIFLLILFILMKSRTFCTSWCWVF